MARRGVDLDHFLPPSPVLGLGKIVVCIYCPSVSWRFSRRAGHYLVARGVAAGHYFLSLALGVPGQKEEKCGRRRRPEKKNAAELKLS